MTDYKIVPVLITSIIKPIQESYTPSFDDFVESIKARGILMPILVRRRGIKYEIIDGVIRYHAAIEAGLTEMPAMIYDPTEAELAEAAMMQSARCIKTKPVEYAKQIKKILDSNQDLTTKSLSEKINKSERWVKDKLSLNRLIEPFQVLVDNEQITLKEAYALARLDKSIQLEKYEKKYVNDYKTYVVD